MLIDTHCHIHESEFYDDTAREAAYARAIAADVAMVCVSTSELSSREAIEFVNTHEHAWATVGVHPHESKDGWGEIGRLIRTHVPKQAPHRQDESPQNTSGRRHNASDTSIQNTSEQMIVGIGEIGLDYFYTHSPREVQIRALEAQLQLALDYDLAVSFHVREAYDDFWPILANFSGIHGVLHSFTDSIENLEIALEKGLFIGVNGLSTFAFDKQAMFDAIPLEKMCLETDAPFLTPVPFRGKVNEPAFVKEVARYHAERRHIPLAQLMSTTSANAKRVFSI